MMFEKITSVVKEFLGENHDITESVREGLADRLSSPFYGYFLVSWFVVNWDFVYSAFFVDGKIIYEKTKLLKNEYLLQKILPVHYISLDYWWTFLVLPLILTFLALWPMQIITRLVYKKHIENKKAEEMIKASALIVKAETETKVQKAETALFEAEVRQAKIEREAEEVSPRLLWKKEYEEFKRHPLFKKFRQVIDSIYTYEGQVHVSYFDQEEQGWVKFDMDLDMLVFADVNGIAEKRETNKVILTDKGKEFVKFYSHETST